MFKLDKTKFKINYIAIGLLFLVAVFFIIFANQSNPSSYNTDYKNIGLPFDHDEIEIYYNRVQFFYHNSLPYEYNAVEYPFLGLMYLTIPALFGNNFDTYQLVLILQNIVFFGLLVFVTYKIIKLKKSNQKYLWLFALPSFLYFVISRFDIFPALLTQLAFLFILQKKYTWSFLLIGLSFLAKGYAIVIFPIFLIFYLWQIKNKKTNILFNRPMFLLIMPTLITIIILGLTAGWNNALFPYLFQSTRSINVGSIYGSLMKIIFPYISNLTWHNVIIITSKILTILQIILPLTLYLGYVITKKLIKTKSDLINWSLLALLLYIVFSPYNSPQWFIWILPLLVLIKWNKIQISLIIIYDLVNFLFFPILFDLYNDVNTIFHTVVLLRTVLLIILILIVINQIKQYNDLLLKNNEK